MMVLIKQKCFPENSGSYDQAQIVIWRNFCEVWKSLPVLRLQVKCISSQSYTTAISECLEQAGEKINSCCWKKELHEVSVFILSKVKASTAGRCFVPAAAGTLWSSHHTDTVCATAPACALNHFWCVHLKCTHKASVRMCAENLLPPSANLDLW